MAHMKSENEALLAKAREERAAILRESKETADKMIAEARTRAKFEYDRIVADAQPQSNNKNAALTDVKNSIGKWVIEVTEK